LNECDVVLYAANGSKIGVLGTATVVFWVSGLPLSAKFVVTDSLDSPILGFGWMSEHNCCWSFTDASFTVDGVVVPLVSRPSDNNNVRRVYTRETVTIPADHAVTVPVKLPALSRNAPLGDWLIEPRAVRPGLLLSRSLMCLFSGPAVKCIG